jgi:hypothetical protein
MKLINSRGRTILEVYDATAQGVAGSGLFGILYSYRGPGIGGNVDIIGLQRKIECCRMDEPSGRIVGELPQPRIR